MGYGRDILNNKAFIFGYQPEVYQVEKNIISELCEKNKLTNCRGINFVDSNTNYDLFFAKCNEGDIVVKLSLDSNYPLDREFSILKENIDSNIVPYPIDCDKKNGINYSILGKLPFQNIENVGRAEVVSSDKSIPYFLSNLRLFTTKIELPRIQDYFNHYLNFNIYKIPEAQITWIENHKAVRALVKEQIYYLQRIIKQKISELNLRDDQFCHGNLNTSNILTDGINLFAINFEQAYLGDEKLQFAMLKHELFYDDYRDRQLFQKYCEIVGIEYDASEYFKYQSLASYLALLQTLINYLTEVYVLKCNRQNKVMQNALKFINNYDSFTILPDYQQKLKPIADFFLKSVK
ncbi:MAG: hypothetical protein ACO3EG_06115 [Chitinophagaceae bacterium]